MSVIRLIVVFLLSTSIAFANAEGIKSDKSALGQGVVNKETDKSGIDREKDKGKVRGRENPTLIVFDMVAEKGVEKGASNLLTEVLMSEISKKGLFKVIGQKDIDKMLFWETNKQLKNCTESSCLMQIAGAMGAEYYVEGSVGSMGNKYVISVKLIETMGVEIKGRSMRIIERDEEKLLYAIKEMVIEMLRGAGMEKEEVKGVVGDSDKEKSDKAKGKGMGIKGEVSGRESKVMGYIIGVGGLGLIGMGGYFTKSAMDARDKYAEDIKYENEKGESERYSIYSVISYVVGGLMLGYGVWDVYIKKEGEGKSVGVMIDKERFLINYSRSF